MFFRLMANSVKNCAALLLVKIINTASLTSVCICSALPRAEGARAWFRQLEEVSSSTSGPHRLSGRPAGEAHYEAAGQKLRGASAGVGLLNKQRSRGRRTGKGWRVETAVHQCLCVKAPAKDGRSSSYEWLSWVISYGCSNFTRVSPKSLVWISQLLYL